MVHSFSYKRGKIMVITVKWDNVACFFSVFGLLKSGMKILEHLVSFILCEKTYRTMYFHVCILKIVIF